MWDNEEASNAFDKVLLATNLVGATTLEDLAYKERTLTNLRAKAWQQQPIKGNFDYKHLKTLHHYIFQDVYTWAGLDRYDMGLYGFMTKGESAFCKGDFIPNQARAIFEHLTKNNVYKDCIKLDDFAKHLTNFMADLNALHPFREGNGRVQRLFLNDIAKNAGFMLDLNLTPKEQMLEASIQSINGNSDKLFMLVRNNLYQHTQQDMQKRLESALRNFDKASDTQQQHGFLTKANQIATLAQKRQILLESSSLQALEKRKQLQTKGYDTTRHQ